jgi:molecular chaperone GrpE
MSDRKKRETKVTKTTKESTDDAEKRGADAPDAADGRLSDEGREKGGEEPSGGSPGQTPAGEDAQAVAEQGEDDDARYMRLAADFQNYKKRTEKEKSDIYAYANEKFAADILDVMDNFERAIGQDAAAIAAETATSDGSDGKFIEGMKLIMEQLVNVLERNDVAEIDALGADFDPNLHHAVQMAESSEYKSGKVTKVVQKGYMIRDKVLRPAMVMVAQ